MKLHECSMQVEKSFKLYDKVYDIHGQISNYFINNNFTKETITFVQLENIYVMVSDMIKVFPKDAIDMNKYFRDINLAPLKLLREQYVTINNELSLLRDINMIDIEKQFNDRIKLIDDILSKKDKPSYDRFVLVREILNFLFNTKEYTKQDVYQKLYTTIFIDLMTIRSHMVNYVCNIELPTKPDWDVGMY